MKEEVIERAVCNYVVENGGQTRKVSWIGAVGAPDRLIMIAGASAFVEFKAPGQKPRASQLKEFKQMEFLGGLKVQIIDNIDEGKRFVGELIRRSRDERKNA